MAAELHSAFGGAGYVGCAGCAGCVASWVRKDVPTWSAGECRDFAMSSSAMIASSRETVLSLFFGIVVNVCKKGDRR
ncbi:hypothetical protein BW12_04255 [Bifidobacterium sp. UTCIF-3]|nr:hypothetical protein BW09_09635 [Bifidobacterium sp. UTCIF-1]TPF79358.1 hypothetical protein BW08_10405 [Bifidobacterium sp. UTCIF-24]TPF82458.1 hypothetical protein BW12_04255 [Bifidobacterium sp. UTCIF-3]TPF84089.1 hypothetical protein BW07_06610 [Bifidobacterium sp. UTCIF-36]TPF88661.1 hypothetical protein BW10_08875 [Bifidobacterium sp. UTBIF-56]TPF93174.1 hypothetical protein BW14_06440 [Bifidobacterium sp. UTBIF-68]